ncbi:MAG: aldehyde oxidase [Candidatus Hydrogenedentota bacterium]|nr:MAG: aldehyde oxidase [Candidatus Hydrogenedentota bacterium]
MATKAPTTPATDDRQKSTKAPSRTQVVGHSVPKVDGLALATGRAQFTADEIPKGTLIGMLLLSPHAHARIRSIDTSAAEALPGVHCVLHHGNVPRIAHTTAGQGYPEPSPYDTFMFDNKVRFVGDRVAAVAAETREIALKALSLIKVEYEILPAVLDPEQALAPDAPIIHDEPDISSFLPFDPKRNLAAWAEATVGDVEKGLAEADVVVGGEFETHYYAHAPIEPHVTLTYLDPNGRIVIRTSTQVPFHCRRIVAQTLGIPVRQIRVIKPRLGGGFGGKQEILLEDVCAMMTLRTGRPVFMELNRAQEFTSSRTRHPMRMWVKMGVKKNGDITAIDFRGILNTGAYGSHALTVLTNVGSKCLGLLHCPNIRFDGKSVYTNLPVAGAYRGYGATQGMMALGQLIDEAARAIGMDPVDFCLRNHIRAGETSPIFKALGEGREGVDMTIASCGLAECIRRGAKAFGWKERRGKGRNLPGPIKRGAGMVILMQGSSIPEIDMAAAIVKLNDDGSVNLYSGATDLGTGADTVLSQIVAETLHIPVNDVILTVADTDNSPFDTGAYASSTTYLSGEAARRAAQNLLEEMRRVAAEALSAEPDELSLGEKCFYVKGSARKKISFEAIARRALYAKNQQQLVGHASAISHVSPPPFAAHFCEVEVDTETGQVRVTRYVAAVDCGVAINPKLAEGQTEGAILNSIGAALTEEYMFNSEGRMLNPTFNYYKLLTAADAPKIETILVETHEPTGPYGAKSVSEINTNGPLPAIANAIYDAVGVRLRKSPYTPERVLEALEEAKRAKD